MSVEVKIPLQKLNGVNKYTSFIFPTLDEIINNDSAILKGTFYLCFKSGVGGSEWDINNIFELGKIGDIEEITYSDLSLLGQTITLSTVSHYVNLLFKFDDDTYNNSNYNEYIKASIYSSNGTLSATRFLTYGLGVFSNYFCYPNSSNSAETLIGSNYTIKDFESVNINTGESDEEPVYKTITLSLFKNSGVGGEIRSNIELYYQIEDTNDLIKLGNSIENDNFNITFNDKKQVYLYFKYVNQNVDISKCIDTFELDSTDLYSVYNETKQMFYLGSITENDTLRERKYVCPVIELQLNNVSCNITEIDYTHDTIIELNASENYFFNVEPFIYYNRGSYSTQTHYFELNEDRSKATLLINTKTTLDGFFHSRLIAVAEIKTIISQDYGLISIYKPNNSILKDLPSKTLYEKEYLITDSGIQKETIDLSKNILSVLSMPIDVEPIGQKEMTLQGLSTSLISDYIDDNIYKIDFGYVDIQGIYNNSVDYKNTKLSIYLPFISTQSLEVNKYMNKKVYLSYTVDLFTGDFLAELKVNNIITDTFSGNLAIKVPYITNSEKSQNVSNYSLLDKNNLLSDRVPKIIIETNTINSDTIFNTLEYKQLNSLSGFNSIDNLVLPSEVKINANELEQLEDLLRSGIIF